MKNEEYTHDTAEIKTVQTTANGTAPLAGNDVANPYTDLAVTEQLPQSLRPAPLRRRQTELPKPFDGLTAAQTTFVADRVMYYIRELCHQRGASVDFKYWRKITKRVLKGLTDRKPLVCPARAGSGKSTWITAFLLAACELRLNNDPLADVFSILLVLQKIESLNSIRDTIADFFPNAPETLVVPLQGWTTAGQQAGFCKNAQVISFDQCPRDNCTYAASCDVLRFGELAGQAFVLGVSQARFDLLRKGNALDGLLYPRLSPQTYLERTFVYWGRSEIREQVQGQMVQWSPLNVQQRPDLHAQLPLTTEYEVRHLAARLEQEIYRCQLRNAVCDEAVHVFLFAPSQALQHCLAERFQGAKLWCEDRTPACIAGAKATVKQYDGNPTVYARFATWLGGWDRAPTPLDGILHDTEIGAESWKKLRKSERFAPLLAQYGAEMTGRGRNVKIEEKPQKCA